MHIARLFVVFFLAATASAQSRNVAYVELGGNAIIPSINYERQLTDHLFGRVGFSVVVGSTADGDEDVTFVVPLMVNYLTHPAGNHHFEAGAGLALVTGDSQDLLEIDDGETISNVVGTATLGYRYQKPGRGFVFKAGATPIFDDSDILPWLGISFGYRW